MRGLRSARSPLLYDFPRIYISKKDNPAMQYVNISERAAVLYFPHGGNCCDGPLALSVRNTTDGRELDIPVAAVSAAGYLVRIEADVPEGLTAGEWQYTLSSGGSVVSAGLIVAGDGRDGDATVEYENEINVIQYE